MARNKKRGKSSWPRGNPFPRGKGTFPRNASGENGGNTSSSHAHGHTLADEARNTAFHRRGTYGRNTISNLRYKPITFVSAGFMEPLKDLEVQLATTDEAGESAVAAGKSPVGAIAATTASIPSKDHVPSSTHEQSPLEPVKTPAEQSAHVPESSSNHASSDHDGDSSEEEVIVFKGRCRNRQEPVSAAISQRNTKADSLELRELDVELQVVQASLRPDTATPEETVAPDDYVPLSSKPQSKRHGGFRKRSRKREINKAVTSDEDAAIIADYMANIQDDIDGDDSEEVQHLGFGSQSFSILRDLGGTDSDAVLDQVLSEDGTGDGSEDDADADAGAEAQQRRIEAEDQRMARMLAKQEELGLSSADVLLFDGDASDDEWLTAPKADPRRKKKGNSNKAKMVQKKGQYPSATQMADAFDELDLMDWHRPSLNNFKKGPPTFDVSDSELEEAMRSTWKKDRLKKAEKKKAREELRSQGLLGRNPDPDDPRVKYLGGMSVDDLAHEFETFLRGSQAQLILPPLDNEARKSIHMLANKFRIKSKSQGKGETRHPVLYRTNATMLFDQSTFDRAVRLVSKSWYRRADADDNVVNKARIFKRAEARSGKSDPKSSAAKVREGDIVGQHASEIGVENKGRAMLEKMGWSKGMALGHVDNKGIIVPISQVVKLRKAGLGNA